MHNQIRDVLAAHGRMAVDPHDVDDHIVYNKASGALFFDSDGTGSHAQIQFATLTNHTSSLSYSDFRLI